MTVTTRSGSGVTASLPISIGRIANEILLTKTPLLASGYIEDARATAKRDEMSDSVKFPSIATNTAAVTTNPMTVTPITAGSFTLSSVTETVAHAMIAMDIEDSARDQLNGFDPGIIQKIAEQVAQTARVKIQADLITEAATTTLSFDAKQAKATWREIMEAKTSLWTENAQDAVPLLLVAPNVWFDIVSSEEAQKVGIYGGTSSVSSGDAPVYFAGCRLMQSSAITAADGVYPCFILRPNALALWTAEAMKFGEQRIGHTTVWQQDWWFSYAVHLNVDQPVGAIKFNVASTLD